MLVTAVTHADARPEERTFRGLTDAGREESVRAAARYLERTGERRVPPVGRIVSSPKPRCLETVILLAKELPDDALATGGLEVDAGLSAGSIEGGELSRLVADADAGAHVLVSGHADLARAVPPGAGLAADAAEDGWFAARPVLFQVEASPARGWNAAEVRFCDALVDGEWRSLIG